MTSHHRSAVTEYPQREFSRTGEFPPHPEQEKQA